MDIDFNIEPEKILSKFTGEKSNLIPILQEFQQVFGYLPEEVMKQIAEFLHLSPGTVYSMATFYPGFKFVPSGKKVVCACRGTACHVRGGAGILKEIEKHLGIKPGETTKYMEYTLETVACLGACAMAPAVTIDKEVHGQMTPKKVSEVLGDK
jgi:NADH:ubiquinone oxidoreductase subunit E